MSLAAVLSSGPRSERLLRMLILPFYPENVSGSLRLLIKLRSPSLSYHVIDFMEHLYKTVITGN